MASALAQTASPPTVATTVSADADDDENVWAQIGDLEQAVAKGFPDGVDGEVDEYLDGLDVRVTSNTVKSNWAAAHDGTVEAFCDSLADDPSRPLRPAGSVRSMPAPVVASAAVLHPAPASAPANDDESLADSTERMLRNVDDVCLTFERLERQFARLERSCELILA